MPTTQFEDIFKKAVGEARSFFRDAFDSATQGAGNYLRDGVPTSITGQAAQRINQRQCEVWGKDPGAFRPVWGQQLREICGPYLENRGLTPVPVPSEKSGFTGGQCATNYRVEGPFFVRRYRCAFQDFTSDFSISTSSQSVLGPVQGWGVRVTTATGATCGPNRLEVFIIGADGIERMTVLQTSTGGQGFRYQNPSGGTLVRTDAMPDNCGDRNPTFSPGSPYGPSLPTPPRLIPGNTSTPEFTVDVNPDGSITICADGLCTTIDPDGDGAISLPEAPADGIDPGNIGEPDTPQDTGAGDEADGEAPEDSVLRALKIDILSSPLNANLYAPGIFRAVCFAYMGTSEGLDHDPAGAMLVSGQLLLAEKDNLTHWKVLANSGYNLRVTPYYLEV